MKITIILILALLPVFARPGGPTYEGLLTEFKKNPESPAAIYNIGLANYLNDKYDDAILYWSKLKSIEPHDWQLRAKIIQAYIAKGDHKSAENEIAELRLLRRSGKFKDLEETKFFIRDQFIVGDIGVYVIEYYDLIGDRALIWKFRLEKNSEPLDRFLSLGSYDTTTQYMRETGKISNEEHAYHLDGYWRSGKHTTYGIYPKKPTYEWAKEKVLRILNGEVKESSSTTVQ